MESIEANFGCPLAREGIQGREEKREGKARVMLMESKHELQREDEEGMEGVDRGRRPFRPS